MRDDYHRTTWACYLSYMVQAVVNNLPPLLFLTFQKKYGISLGQLGLLIVLNFGVQISVDLLAGKLAEKWGYRATMIFGHVCAAVGLLCMGLLPSRFGLYGLIIAMVLDSVGGGVVEVLVSPIVQAIPDDSAKNGALSMLHSFYCWGTVAVILVTTVLYGFVGLDGWHLIPYVWIVLPLLCIIFFSKCPIAPLIKAGEKGMTTKELLHSPLFWVLALMMSAASCSELSMSQWASYFAESGLGVSKQFGDLLGPCLFAFLMGLVRFFYGKHGGRISLLRLISASSVVCLLGYLLASLARSPILALFGCAICGPAVALFWPGTFSLASDHLPLGGTRMFALLAFFGDAGCAIGPEVVSLVSQGSGDLRSGLLLSSVFPVCMGILTLALPVISRRDSSRRTRRSQDRLPHRQ